MPALQREGTFARTYHKGIEFLAELPHCGWKALGIVVATAIVLFSVGSTAWVVLVWTWGGQTLSLSVPEVVTKGAPSADVGL